MFEFLYWLWMISAIFSFIAFTYYMSHDENFRRDLNELFSSVKNSKDVWGIIGSIGILVSVFTLIYSIIFVLSPIIMISSAFRQTNLDSLVKKKEV